MVPELAKVPIPNTASLPGAFLPEAGRKMWRRAKDTGPGIGSSSVTPAIYWHHNLEQVTSPV